MLTGSWLVLYPALPPSCDLHRLENQLPITHQSPWEAHTRACAPTITHTQTNHTKSAIHLFYAKRTHAHTHTNTMISLNAPRHTQRSDTMTPPHTHACSPPQHLLFRTPRCTSNQPCVRVPVSVLVHAHVCLFVWLDQRSCGVVSGIKIWRYMQTSIYHPEMEKEDGVRNRGREKKKLKERWGWDVEAERDSRHVHKLFNVYNSTHWDTPSISNVNGLDFVAA